MTVVEPGREGDGPSLSVILPCWNAEAFVERAIRSVLDERGVPLELIVVDDGSTDRTPEIVARLATTDDRLRVIRQAENLGVSQARNVAIDAARGRWLAYVDADDIVLPGAFGALMAPTEDPAVAIVAGQRVWSDGQRQWQTKGYQIPDIQEPGRKGLATHRGLLYYLSLTGKAFRRADVADVRFQGRVLGDLAWTLGAYLRAGDGIQIIDRAVYQWNRPSRDRPFSTITADSRASLPKAVASARGATATLRLSLDDIDRFVADPAARADLRRGIFDRLVHVDLAPALAGAIRRRDQDIGELFQAEAEYVASAPAEVARSAVLLEELLVPALRTWPWLTRQGRAALWSLVGEVARHRPTTGREVGRGRGVAAAIWLAGHRSRGVAVRGADLLVAFGLRARRLRGRLSRGRATPSSEPDPRDDRGPEDDTG